MFKGEDSTTLETSLSFEKVTSEVEEALAGLGRVNVSKKGDITIEASSKYKTTFADTVIDGALRASKKSPSSYTLTISYDVSPTLGCWCLAIFGGPLTGCLLFLILLIPMKKKGEVQRDVVKTLRVVEDAIS